LLLCGYVASKEGLPHMTDVISLPQWPVTNLLSNQIPSRNSAAKQVCVDSAELLKGQKVIEIKHNGAVYRLQATKLGKLILTK
jgi:hemin uptake protein HemP